MASEPMTAVCRGCAKEGHFSFSTRDRNRRIGSEDFRYYECASCGLIFLAPIPEDLGRYYPTSYYTLPPTREALEAEGERERYKLELVQRFVRSGKMLEIGPAWGAFASLARRTGFEVDCVELDAACCEYLRDVANVRAIHATNPAVAMASLTTAYDVICLWQNLEHLPDPRETVVAAARLLAPGGMLVIATPNPDSLQYSIFGAAWTHVDAPRHLQLIPARLLREWGREAGLEARLVTTLDRGSRGWNRFGWTQTLANMVSNRPAQIVLRIIGLGLTLVALPLELTGFRGSCYSAVLEKRVR